LAVTCSGLRARRLLSRINHSESLHLWSSASGAWRLHEQPLQGCEQEAGLHPHHVYFDQPDQERKP
jgi:hypothetical protein